VDPYVFVGASREMAIFERLAGDWVNDGVGHEIAAGGSGEWEDGAMDSGDMVDARSDGWLGGSGRIAVSGNGAAQGLAVVARVGLKSWAGARGK
jgi:hypothetical protein